MTAALHPTSLHPDGRPFTLADFDFHLPPELIAQHPAPERSASRLLDGSGPVPVDRIFRDLPTLLRPTDLLVFNDTQVIKARLFGEKATGGKLELLVERVLPHHEVVAHMKVSKKPPLGGVIHLAGGCTAATTRSASSGCSSGAKEASEEASFSTGAVFDVSGGRATY